MTVSTAEQLRIFLDRAITSWREIKTMVEEDSSRSGDLDPETQILMAKCYIDAFQSVRGSILGELLP